MKDKLEFYKQAREDYQPMNWTMYYICEMSPVFKRGWKDSMEEIMEDAREFLLNSGITSQSVSEPTGSDRGSIPLFYETELCLPKTCEEREERNKAFHSIRIQFLDYMIEKLSRP